MAIPETLESLIERHEGRRVLPYLDSRGVWTVGVGHNLAKPLSARVVQQLFEDDLGEAMNECLHAFPWFADLTIHRQWVLVDMCFNLGLTKLSHFTKMMRALSLGDYETAAKEMLDSDWATQVGPRAQELAHLMRGEAEV